MNKIVIFVISSFVIVVLWAAYLFCWPHMNIGSVFNPNPPQDVIVGTWQSTNNPLYETRTIVDPHLFYTIYADQKRQTVPNALVIGDTTRLNYTLNVQNVAVAISVSLIGLFILQTIFFKLFPVVTVGGRGFPVKLT